MHLCSTKNVILEVHHEFSGVTKMIYFILRTVGLLRNLNYIFIHKNLIKIFNVRKGSYIYVLMMQLRSRTLILKEKNYLISPAYILEAFMRAKG